MVAEDLAFFKFEPEPEPKSWFQSYLSQSVVFYAQEEISKLSDNVQTDSKLHPQVQNLMKLIFDIDTLKKTMVEFEVGCCDVDGKAFCP